MPAVETLANSVIDEHRSSLPRWSVLAAARAILEETRATLRRDPDGAAPSAAELACRTQERAARLARPFPRRVINATGVVLHTNLGRAPLSIGAAEAIARVATGYSELEIDLDEGRRGSRTARPTELIRLLSGAEDALVVNNNAAALFMVLDVLAADREVVVSRGELVEIGGSFRVPDIMAASRARLVEVGTTNRTHPADYARAIGERTALLLKVHRSNFHVSGFTKEVELPALAALAREHDLPLVEDRGSGSFVDLRPLGLPDGPVSDGLAAGADLVLFSGDKLLGGPQAGIVIGAHRYVERLRRHPLARVLRVDKLTLAALDWTLRALLGERDHRAMAHASTGDAPRHRSDGTSGRERPVPGYAPGYAEGRSDIPTLRMLGLSDDAVRARAEDLAKRLVDGGLSGVSIEREDSLVGGGSLPDVELAGAVVRVRPQGSADALARKLRRADPPVLVRVHKGALVLDPRTLFEGDFDVLARLLCG